jgi:tetratricopeptide (TPR) repeat protein
VELDSALAWVERMVRRARYQEAWHIVQGLREKAQSLLEKGGPLVRAWLDALEGLALAYIGNDLAKAEVLLQGAIRVLQAFEPEDSSEAWDRRFYLAEALNTQGYLYRTLGRYHQAIEAYQRTLPLYGLLAEDRTQPKTTRQAVQALHANTINNLSWALAERGAYQAARRQCEDGLLIRTQLGPRGPIAFSLNTLGMIQMRDDHPFQARVNCHKALDIFRGLGQTRGIGLASIALAEALRRSSWAETEISPPAQRAEYLREAREHCAEAVKIFDLESGPVKERPRLIEALIEQGCTYRDWVTLGGKYGGYDPDRPSLAYNAEAALRRAIEVGEVEPGLAHKVTDAQVNLAWLYFYMDEYEQASQEIEAAKKRVPPEYYLPVTQHGADLPETFFWVQLGKAHLLEGQVALRKFEADPKNLDLLPDVGYHYTLSLAYDELFAPDFRDMRRGMDRIYHSLKGLRRGEEFPLVYQGAEAAAEAYRLAKPTRLYEFLNQSFGTPHEVL